QKHHVYQQYPLGQSLMAGSQTPCDLLSIQHDVIRAYKQALEGPIRDYLSHIGTEEAHPLTTRNQGGYQFAGCWSVVLTSGGRHVNHVHPEGWISSAYYVQVPDEVGDPEGRPGWIKFGEPPFPMPGSSGPEKWIQPRPGTLVLFPSYLWHGTEPIKDGSTRITAPFDLKPS
ncbi:MAG: 2OG-Fe(II) oxygenase family protein, partial [Pseudomonadota bacterium]